MANVVPSSQILVTLMMEAVSSSEMSVLTRATQRNIQKTPFFKQISWSYEHFSANAYLYRFYYVSFAHISVSQSSAMGTQNSMRIMYNASLLNEL
jgi:hypothetical protein